MFKILYMGLTLSCKEVTTEWTAIKKQFLVGNLAPTSGEVTNCNQRLTTKDYNVFASLLKEKQHSM